MSDVCENYWFLAKIQAISTLSEDDSDDEMLMRPLFERLGGNKIDYEVKV